MWNIIKRILNSIVNGLFDAILAGILIIVCFVVLDEDNWLFTLSLIIIAFFSSIYHYKNNK